MNLDIDVDNVILLSIDALRADHLSCYGYSRETSPVLDQLAADNIRFENAYSASSHTRESIPSLLTGAYPDSAITASYRRNAESIASVAKRAGLATAGFHSNPFVSRAYGFDDGFDKFDDDLHLGQHRLIALAQRVFDKLRNRHYARGDKINQRAIEWLESLREVEPFFLWNHYMDVHGPYEPVGRYRRHYTNEYVSDRDALSLYKRAIKNPESITEDERKLLIDYYDSEIRYTDECLQEFLESLNGDGTLDNSLLIITSDHGDAFGEHGYYEHPRYLDDELVHVPLIVAHPDLTPQTVETAVSTTDIAATIAQFLGEGTHGVGESLFGLLDASDDRTVFQQARGEGEDSDIRRFAARTSRESAFAEYDLTTETTSVTTADSDGIREALLAHITDRAGSTHSDDSEESIANEEIEQRLSALGYK